MASEQSGSRPIVRVVLLLVLGVLIVAGIIDWRARGLSVAADQQLTEVDVSGEAPDSTAIQSTLGRPPATTTPVDGGVIERYSYSGGIPGRTYTVSVGYAEDADGQLRYVAHSLNKVEEEDELALVISNRGKQVSQPSSGAEDYGEGGGGGGGRGGGGGGGGGNFREGLMSNDADGDGKLTAEELGERGERMLERGDTNGDGALDGSELDAMMAQWQGGGGSGRGGGGRGGGGGDDRPERPRRPEMEDE